MDEGRGGIVSAVGAGGGTQGRRGMGRRCRRQCPGFRLRRLGIWGRRGGTGGEGGGVLGVVVEGEVGGEVGRGLGGGGEGDRGRGGRGLWKGSVELRMWWVCWVWETFV